MIYLNSNPQAIKKILSATFFWNRGSKDEGNNEMISSSINVMSLLQCIVVHFFLLHSNRLVLIG